MEMYKDEENQVAIFKIGTEEYAVGVAEVERVIEFEKATKIPEAPVYLEGVISYDEKIIPVIDLRMRFKLDPINKSTDSKIIIVKDNNLGHMGFIIDSMSEITNIKKSFMVDPPEIIAGIIKKFIKSIIRIDGRTIIYLELKEVLNLNEKQAVKQIINK